MIRIIKWIAHRVLHTIFLVLLSAGTAVGGWKAHDLWAAPRFSVMEPPPKGLGYVPFIIVRPPDGTTRMVLLPPDWEFDGPGWMPPGEMTAPIDLTLGRQEFNQ